MRMSLRSKADFKALILAGGYATRLYPITLDVSKPLLRINNRTIIDFSLKQLNEIKSLREVFVITNDKFYKDFLKWKKNLKIRKKVTIINDNTKTERSRLGSVGDIYYAIRERKIDRGLLVIGGDNIFDRGLCDFIRFAQRKSPAVSIGIYDLRRKSKARLYGVVKINKDHKILEFKEKPKYPASSLIAMCLYFFPKSTLHLFREYVKKLKLDTDKSGFYIRWLLEKIKVYGFRFKGLWLDIGEMKTYIKAQRYFK